jgi:hypothetical protein
MTSSPAHSAHCGLALSPVDLPCARVGHHLPPGRAPGPQQIASSDPFGARTTAESAIGRGTPALVGAALRLPRRELCGMSAGSGQPPPVVGRLCRVRLPLPGGGEARGLSRRSCASRPEQKAARTRSWLANLQAQRTAAPGWMRVSLDGGAGGVPAPPEDQQSSRGRATLPLRRGAIDATYAVPRRRRLRLRPHRQSG